MRDESNLGILTSNFCIIRDRNQEIRGCVSGHVNEFDIAQPSRYCIVGCDEGKITKDVNISNSVVIEEKLSERGRRVCIPKIFVPVEPNKAVRLRPDRNLWVAVCH